MIPSHRSTKVKSKVSQVLKPAAMILIHPRLSGRPWPALCRSKSQRCLFKVGNGIARRISKVERTSCYRKMSYDSMPIPKRKDQLRKLHTHRILVYPIHPTQETLHPTPLSFDHLYHGPHNLLPGTHHPKNTIAIRSFKDWMSQQPTDSFSLPSWPQSLLAQVVLFRHYLCRAARQ